MDLLKDYGSDSDGGGEAPASTVEAPTTVLARRVETAPAVLGALSLMKRPGSKAWLDGPRLIRRSFPNCP